MRKRGGPMSVKRRSQAQEAFLLVFAESANLTQAAAAAGVNRSTVYDWQEHDETFSMRYKQAEAEACDVIRAAVHEHAIRGWDEPVVSMGKVVYVDNKPLMLHKYDSSLLARLAAARLPEFREKVDINANIQGNMSHDFADDPEAAALARALIRRVSSSGTTESSGARVSGEQ